MPALTFGLIAAKAPTTRPSKPPQKRKALFGDDNSDEDSPPAPLNESKKVSKPLRPLSGFGLGDEGDQDGERPRKSPKLSGESGKYANLSALRSARLHDAAAARADAAVYDYDGAYETFHAPTNSKNKDAATGGSGGAKYMGSLLQSAEVRKRDQLRAKEKLLQKERENEGEEFADKEKFVTGAYKRQQEEMKVQEEEEKKREEREEERRRKGGGMAAFHMRMLEKDEERMRGIEEAVKRKEEGSGEIMDGGMGEEGEEAIAKEMNEKGGRIVVNDEGEVVDKRQLLSAGLNSAPKKSGAAIQQEKKTQEGHGQEYYRSTKAQDARMSQRERQTKMMERQIEEIAAKERRAEQEEEKAREEKTKSKLTEADKMGAKERYLQRKREREEEAKKAKATKES